MRQTKTHVFVMIVLLMGLLSIQSQARKMSAPIVYGKPWIETRLTYSITASDLAQKYYGNDAEVSELIKANKTITNARDILTKDMVIHIPVTNNFKDQPERLGWVSGKAPNF